MLAAIILSCGLALQAEPSPRQRAKLAMTGLAGARNWQMLPAVKAANSPNRDRKTLDSPQETFPK